MEPTNLIQKDITNVLSDSYLEYASYNIQRRAIPDSRDGLKWGARQLLYSQALGGFTYDKPFKKAIKSVSQAMGFCYVHGDASAYGTFIRMAKPFAYRYPLQEANGTYGTLIDPEDHSASRYVELRGSHLAALAMQDIKKETITEWEDTYDLEGQFPKVLPCKGIWLGVNGCISIGSGMSCSIPPTNLKEVNNVLIKLVDNPNLSDEECVCMPDFPTGATIINGGQTKQSMIKGTGFACKIRASVEWDKKERCFIVKEMPYATYINTICKELVEIMEEQSNCGIVDWKDYTKKEPDLRIYLDKKANPDKVLRFLYKNTSLETFFTINMVMLDNGVAPKVFTWKEMLQAHIDHEKVVYRRGFEYDLRKIKNRIHIIDGLLICLARIDEVVATIKGSASTAAAASELMKKFLLDDAQAKAVLDMKLSRLAHLEVKKLEDERTNLLKEADHLNEILNDEVLFNNELKKGWREVAEKFGDARRTKVIQLAEGSDNEPIEEKQLSLAFTNMGAVYVSETSTLYSQRRNGAGTKFKLEKEEYIIDNIVGKNTSELLFFTDKGNFYHKSMGEFMIDEKQYLTAMVNMGNDEKVVTAALCSKSGQKQHIIFITKNGILKKSKLSEYNLKRNSGALAIKLDAGDEIVSIMLTDDDRIGITSAQGQFIMIETKDISAIGRVARGVQGMKLNDGDCVVGARLINSNDKELISVSTDGYIKRTPINEFRVTGRATKGVKIQNTKSLCDFLPVGDESDILVVSTSSQIRLKFKDIPSLSRGTQGVKSLKLSSGAQVITLSKL